MERPRVITGDDAWRAYQCDLLENLLKVAEEIRDLLKEAQEPINIEVPALSAEKLAEQLPGVLEEMLKEKAKLAPQRVEAPPAADSKPPASKASTRKPRSTSGAQKGGGQSGKNV